MLVDFFKWEYIIVDFCFLKFDNIGLMLFDYCSQLMRLSMQVIDIKRDKFYGQYCIFVRNDVEYQQMLNKNVMYNKRINNR